VAAVQIAVQEAGVNTVSKFEGREHWHKPAVACKRVSQSEEGREIVERDNVVDSFSLFEWSDEVCD
jgi:hypothetical protein